MIRPIETLKEEYYESMKVWDTEVMALCIELGVPKNHRRDDILHWFGLSLEMFDSVIDYYGIEHWLDYAKKKSFEYIFPQYQKPKAGWWKILNYYISKGIFISEVIVYQFCLHTKSEIKYEINPATQDIIKFYKEN